VLYLGPMDQTAPIKAIADAHADPTLSHHSLSKAADQQAANQTPEPPGFVLPFLGIPVAALTIYDLLGWLLSVTTSPPPSLSGAQPLELGYYLPLLSMYAKWVLVFSEECNSDREVSSGTPAKQDIAAQPGMVSIAYFDLSKAGGASGPDKGTCVMLGSTIGNPIARPTTIMTNRQQEMSELYVPDHPQPSLQPTAFGKCAETAFWIFARR